MLDYTPLYDAAKKLADLYRSNLLQDGYLATGALANFKYNIDFNGQSFELTFILPKEYRWAEDGRKPSQKMPPVNNILQWIRIRKLVPKAKNGKVPKVESTAWAIAKHIQKHGFEGKHTLRRTIEQGDNVINEIVVSIANILNKDIEEDMIHLTDGLKTIK